MPDVLVAMLFSTKRYIPTGCDKTALRDANQKIAQCVTYFSGRFIFGESLTVRRADSTAIGTLPGESGEFLFKQQFVCIQNDFDIIADFAESANVLCALSRPAFRGGRDVRLFNGTNFVDRIHH